MPAIRGYAELRGEIWVYDNDEILERRETRDLINGCDRKGVPFRDRRRSVLESINRSGWKTFSFSILFLFCCCCCCVTPFLEFKFSKAPLCSKAYIFVSKAPLLNGGWSCVGDMDVMSFLGIHEFMKALCRGPSPRFNHRKTCEALVGDIVLALSFALSLDFRWKGGFDLIVEFTLSPLPFRF
ncbi:hypothetical protein A2U01_0008337 [Trifolium medium]|uniref:Uncharacterized protein n=1 Tax=Trifolium medium TaxID=97028 RepID=A0A392MJ08_9FABA|nr:hypothetical protein [Trifolium medium]